MRIVVLAATGAAVLALLLSLQMVAGLLRTLPVERRVRRTTLRSGAGRAPAALPAALLQLENEVQEGLAGDRYALAVVARHMLAAAHRCGVDPSVLAAAAGPEGDLASPAGLMQALDRLEKAAELPGLPGPL
ncbi:MAG: hypothetical protein QOJ19_1394 [Acidimicrobiia bacterium]|nr:hypothetical protein [Acidimicrobiia bacterium]